MKPPPPTPRRLLIVLPSWVGDAAMATPTLRAIRGLHPDAQITLLLKSYVRPVIDASPWHDRLLVARPRSERSREPGRGMPRRRRGLLSRLRRRRFDTAVLLPNSLRSALLVSTAGIPRRIGYDRDGRGLLLTDRLLPMRKGGRFACVSAVDYYLGLARYLGAASPDRRLQLFTRPEDDARADALLSAAGVDLDRRPIVLLNPGAATKGELKLWPAERFAAIADRLAQLHGATVLVSGSPSERGVLDAVRRAGQRPMVDLLGAGSNLTLLKSVLRRCSLVVTNDTGARHLAAGMGAAVVGLFGPTDPGWTTLDFDREIVIHAADRRMESIPVERVAEACERLLCASPSRQVPLHA